MLPSEVFDLFETVLTDANNRIGGNLLGTYTRKDGHSYPAMTIGDPGKAIEKVEGLEVIIPLMPSGDSGGTTPGEIEREERWTVTLVERSPPPLRSPKLPEAISRLEAVFNFSFQGRCTYTYLPGAESIGAYPQANFTFWACQRHCIANLVQPLKTGLL